MDILRSSTPRALFADLAARLRRGAVLVLPTDTLYGLTAHAIDVAAVDAALNLKRRRTPATIIPHDAAWAASLVEARHRAAVSGLLASSGGDTLLFRYDPERDVPVPAPALVESGLVAFRQPRHWIADLAVEARLPLITTSANVTGEPPMTGVHDLDPRVAVGVEACVDEGVRTGRPSALVYLDGDAPRRVERR